MCGKRTAQAFVDEMINLGKMKWLEELGSSNDKKGLIAKVTCSDIRGERRRAHATIRT